MESSWLTLLLVQAGAEIPLTAWEQATVVALFVVAFLAFLGALLSWFSRMQKDWQAFMRSMNDEWRQWLDDANCREGEAMGKVTIALDRLAEKLDAHDEKVDDRISRAISSVTKRGGRAQ